MSTLVRNSKFIEHGVLDGLHSDNNVNDCKDVFYLKSFLSALEHLATHWSVLAKGEYSYRLEQYGQINSFVDELPRAIGSGKLFSVKTFVLSCRTPYMKTRQERKLFISKEYSNAAGKLHLAFYATLEQVARVAEEAQRLHAQSRRARQKENQNSNVSRLHSVKNWLSSLVQSTSTQSASLIETGEKSELDAETRKQEALRTLRAGMNTLD